MNRICGLQIQNLTDLNTKGNSHPFISEEILYNYEKEIFDLAYNNMLVKNFSNGLISEIEFNSSMSKEERRKVFLSAKKNKLMNQ